MENAVNGIREVFYRDLTGEYQDKRERSFLYRAFWAECVARLLEKYFPQLSAEDPLRPEDEVRIRKRLSQAMGERPERARSLLLREAPGKGRKERRDFWEELWLNDAGYRAGLISDTEYYLWLVEYLTARDVYYKDNSMWDGHAWLYRLLLAGLRGTERALEPGQMQRDGENIRTKAQVGRDMAELARLIRDERDAGRAEAAGRLHGLKCRVRIRGQEARLVDYLPWLTGRLERMALHIKIKTWLQDSGYPLGEGNRTKKPPKEPRKQDFSMRLFEAYCDSAEGYHFHRKDRSGGTAGWQLDGMGFCALEPGQIGALQAALERSGTAYLYLPLAVDLLSGCVFFLAGKENYTELYRGAGKKLRDAYQGAKARWCFDYLRLDEARREELPGDVGGALRLRPTFHENAGRSYQAVLNDFKRYCMTGDHSPRQAVREFNEEGPSGVPDGFRWGFDASESREEPGKSRLAAASFGRAWKGGRNM